jgi:hypothetical protein
MTLEDVVAFVSAERDPENIIAVLNAISVWHAVRDNFGVGGQALSVEDFIRRAMTDA